MLANKDPLPTEDQDEWKLVEKHAWNEFNDEACRSYMFSKLENDAFGGGYESYAPSGFGETNNKNAYMLFYEKRKKNPLKVVVPEDQAERLDEANPLTSLIPNLKDLETSKDQETQEVTVEADFNSIELFVEKIHYQRVHEDNLKFLFERYVLQTGFSDCTDNLIKLLTKNDAVTAKLIQNEEFMKFLEYLVFDFKPRVSEKAGVKMLIDAYEKILDRAPVEVSRLINSRILPADNSYLIQTIKALDVKIRTA